MCVLPAISETHVDHFRELQVVDLGTAPRIECQHAQCLDPHGLTAKPRELKDVSKLLSETQ